MKNDVKKMDDELKKALEDGEVLSIGEIKVSERTLESSIDVSHQKIKLNMMQFNAPIGVDFEKTLSPPVYLTIRALFKSLLNIPLLSPELRYQMEPIIECFEKEGQYIFQENLQKYLKLHDSQKKFKLKKETALLLGLKILLQSALKSLDKDLNQPVTKATESQPESISNDKDIDAYIESLSLNFHQTKRSSESENFQYSLIQNEILLWSRTILNLYTELHNGEGLTFTQNLLLLIEKGQYSQVITKLDENIENIIQKKKTSKKSSRKKENQGANDAILLGILWGIIEILSLDVF